MQIDAITIEKLLSFDTFVWKNLDPHLNVIVGPNGVGKTNLFRALRMVHDVLSPEQAQTSVRWDTVGHQSANADTITISLDIQFTTAWEKRLLCVFLASVLCNQQEIQQKIQQEIQTQKEAAERQKDRWEIAEERERLETRNGLEEATEMERQRSLTQNGLKRFDAWMLDRLRPEDITWFLHGRLVLTHAGRSGWQCRYEARSGEPGFRLDLSNSSTLLGHAKHHSETTTQNWGSLFVAWYHSLPERERERLINGLASVSPEGEFPLPNFSRLPNWISSQQGVGLQVDDQLQIVDPTMLATRQALTSAARLSSLEPGRLIGARIIFQRLLEQALVFTDNVRLPHQRQFTARDLSTQPFDLSNGKELARFLFCKKNGGPGDRQQYASIEQMFSQMTGCQFTVVQNAAGNDGSQQEPQSDISLELVTIDSWGDIPLEFSGAGIAEALFLSAVLAGSSGQTVLLDEPALNLHPTMQTALLEALQTLAHQPAGERSQFLVNTHTPTLIPPDEIEHVSRLTLQRGHAVRQALKVSQNDMVKLKQLLRGNLEVRAFLFSRAVLLVEGETELGALPVWCPEIVRQDIALYAVGGRGAFVSPLRFIQNFGIPWAIIGDGEVLWDLSEKKSRQGPQGQVERILAVCSRPLPSIPGDPGSNLADFRAWQQTLEACGIFTLANGADEGFEKAIQTEISPDLWNRANLEFGANKVARGRFIAENCPCPTKVAALIHSVLCHLQKQDAGISALGGNSP